MEDAEERRATDLHGPGLKPTLDFRLDPLPCLPHVHRQRRDQDRGGERQHTLPEGLVVCLGEQDARRSHPGAPKC